RRLLAERLFKNQILFEAIRRLVGNIRDDASCSSFEAAADLLADVQDARADIAAEFWVLPQVSSWAAACLLDLTGPPATSESARSAEPRLTEYASIMAATAALRAGQPFELPVPVRAGQIVLPGLGTVRVDGASAARLRCSGDQLEVVADDGTVRLPPPSELA